MLSIDENNIIMEYFLDWLHRNLIPKYNNGLWRGGNNNDVYEFGATIDELNLGSTSAFIVKPDYLTPQLLKKSKKKII